MNNKYHIFYTPLISDDSDLNLAFLFLIKIDLVFDKRFSSKAMKILNCKFINNSNPLY